MRYQRTAIQELFFKLGNLCFIASLSSATILVIAIIESNRSNDAGIILTGFAFYLSAIVFKELARVRIPKYPPCIINNPQSLHQANASPYHDKHH